MLKITNIEIQNNKEACENINLIIGPNNNGKTTLLNEIFGSASGVLINKDFKWIKEIDVKSINIKETITKLIPTAIGISSFDLVKNLKDTGYKSFNNNDGTWNSSVLHRIQNIADGDSTYKIDHRLVNGQDEDWHFWRFFINSLITIETCDTRASGTFVSQIRNIIGDQDEDILKYIFKNKETLNKIQNNIKDVFGFKIGFDDLRQGELALRILPNPPIKKRGDSAEVAIEWQKRSPVIISQGHGLKAYLKIVFSLLQQYKSIIFIDEPETFLHPPQRRALGTLVAKLAKEENKQVFISTHDTEFLRGILSSEIPNIKIFYLKKQNETFSYISFGTSDVEKLLKKERSNLLNERILNSFFYKKTILCEYEDDRVFYENVSARYRWDIFQDVNFVGLSGIDEILEVFKRLIKLNLNVGIIVDIDFLIYRNFPDYIEDEELKDKFGQFKGEFKKNLNLSKESDKKIFDNEIKEFKKNGVNFIKIKKPNLEIILNDLIKKFKKHSIYIVPVGQFESWTNSNHKDLQNALEVIKKKKKKKLNEFITEVLSK